MMALHVTAERRTYTMSLCFIWWYFRSSSISATDSVLRVFTEAIISCLQISHHALPYELRG